MLHMLHLRVCAQSPTLKTWQGKPENKPAAQEMLVKLVSASFKTTMMCIDHICKRSQQYTQLLYILHTTSNFPGASSEVWR
jgi:hypothetical protein